MFKQPKSLPQTPSLESLGLAPKQTQKTPAQPKSKVSDGTKRVNYQGTQKQNVRPFQTRRGRRERGKEGGRGIPTKHGKVTPKIVPYRATPSTIPVTVETTSSGATSTQKRKKKIWTKPYPEMKITPYGEEIAEYIQQFPVFAIDSPTGTGKTRYIPYLMAKKGFIVRVAIPTTVAVRDAYAFQRKYSGLRVGYAAGREIHYSDTDQLVYGTTGHFTQKILSYIKFNQVGRIRKLLGDIFFIDEVHTSTSQITLLIGLIRHLYTKDDVYSGPKLVFSTATFNHGDIVDHFSDFPVFQPQDIIKAFPVEPIFMDTVQDPLMNKPDQGIYLIVQKELDKWLTSDKKYHGIVFRPGVMEVESTLEYLEKKFPIDDPIDFYPAYSGLSKDEIDQIFEESDRMKVIIGTNIIESGVTIDDVGFVIDDVLEKIAETSSTGGDKLTLSLISQAASLQRSGRTGRTLPGRAYRLITESQFRELKPFRQKEIDRVPIFNIVLQLIDAGLDPREILKISLTRYDQARRTLTDFGMIEIREDKYAITEIGQFVSSITMGIHNAYLIYLAFQRYQKQALSGDSDLDGEKLILRSAIAVASMIEVYGPSFFFVPRKTRNETYIEYTARKDAYIEQYHEKFRGETDIHTLVNIFWQMMTDINMAQRYDKASRNRVFNYVREWSKDNSMNNKKLKEFLTVMRDIESTVEGQMSGKNANLKRNLPVSATRLGKNLPEGGYTQLGNVVSDLFSRAYLMNRFYREIDHNGVEYLDRKTDILYKISKSSSFSKIFINKTTGPGEIIAAQTMEVVAQRGKINLAGIIISDEYFAPELKESKPNVPIEQSETVSTSSLLSPKSTGPKSTSPKMASPYGASSPQRASPHGASSPQRASPYGASSPQRASSPESLLSPDYGAATPESFVIPKPPIGNQSPEPILPNLKTPEINL